MQSSDGPSSQDNPAAEGNGIALLRKIWNIPGKRARIEKPLCKVSTNIYDVPQTTKRIPPRRHHAKR